MIGIYYTFIAALLRLVRRVMVCCRALSLLSRRHFFSAGESGVFSQRLVNTITIVCDLYQMQVLGYNLPVYHVNQRMRQLQLNRCLCLKCIVTDISVCFSLAHFDVKY